MEEKRPNALLVMNRQQNPQIIELKTVLKKMSNPENSFIS